MWLRDSLAVGQSDRGSGTVVYEATSVRFKNIRAKCDRVVRFLCKFFGVKETPKATCISIGIDVDQVEVSES